MNSTAILPRAVNDIFRVWRLEARGRLHRPARPSLAARAFSWRRQRTLGMAQSATLTELTTDYEHCAAVFERYGCFIVDDAIESPEMLSELEAAARRVVDTVQSGGHGFSLDTEKGTGNNPAATQINALIAQEYGEPVFQAMMASDAVAKYADLLLPHPIRLWFCAMWCLNDNQPGREQYDSTWHRDTSGILGTKWGEDLDEGRELDILSVSPEQVGRCLKWSTALAEGGDPCLFLCPGSHDRFRTVSERHVLVEDPRAPMGSVEGEVQITLKRGQTVFWAGTLVHRGLQPPGCTERLSMTCGLQAHGREDVPLHKGHQWEWCRAESIRPTLAPRMQGYWDRCEKRHLLVGFPYVCPEPVLAERSFLMYKWLKSAVLCRWIEACDGGAQEEQMQLQSKL
jgi:ectoine hydroxylase-related dioxygenase (phytanoyl-CoA dioxygenase family)